MTSSLILQKEGDAGVRKPLWRYIKSKRQDGNGVSPLKENGQLHSDSGRKAEIGLLNNQFCSVLPRKTPQIYLNYQDHRILKCLISKLLFKV